MFSGLPGQPQLFAHRLHKILIRPEYDFWAFGSSLTESKDLGFDIVRHRKLPVDAYTADLVLQIVACSISFTVASIHSDVPGWFVLILSSYEIAPTISADRSSLGYMLSVKCLRSALSLSTMYASASLLLSRHPGTSCLNDRRVLTAGQHVDSLLR